ncbi:hypothetical protein ETB97_008991 [Aspergillus alliaceus]|uniref:Uncharacterized protein n=1 Tax=Petromyces alliaceus TaxID=209559 RepID=A0A8H5ZX78_PETAA|nr:hypothetical protein ETB97_008991 [Aspergillus burnettii]
MARRGETITVTSKTRFTVKRTLLVLAKGGLSTLLDILMNIGEPSFLHSLLPRRYGTKKLAELPGTLVHIFNEVTIEVTIQGPYTGTHHLQPDNPGLYDFIPPYALPLQYPHILP